MAVTNREQQLVQTLDLLESAALAPLVPGEAASWVGAIAEAAQELQQRSVEQIETVHPRQFARILKQDPEMVTRVQHLKQEDEQILHTQEKLIGHSKQTITEGEQAEPDEAAIHKELAAVSKQAVALVLRIRKQEVAIATWLQEAFSRDRGVAD